MLQPAVEGGSEEGKGVLRHALVLERDILADDGKAFGQPVLEIGGSFEDIHLEPSGFPVG
jgi:hypothetical protein